MRRILAVLGLAALCVGITSSWAVRAETQDRDTHGRDAVPDYARVFAQDTVKRLDMRVTASDWDRLVADMTEMAGVRGADGVGGGGGFNVAPNPQALAACAGGVEGDFCTFGAPPQSGRCTILPNGAGLTCTALPGVGIVHYDRLDLLSPEAAPALLEDLRKRTHLPIERVEIGNVDLLRDSADLTIHYRPQK